VEASSRALAREQELCKSAGGGTRIDVYCVSNWGGIDQDGGCWIQDTKGSFLSQPLLSARSTSRQIWPKREEGNRGKRVKREQVGDASQGWLTRRIVKGGPRMGIKVEVWGCGKKTIALVARMWQAEEQKGGEGKKSRAGWGCGNPNPAFPQTTLTHASQSCPPPVKRMTGGRGVRGSGEWGCLGAIVGPAPPMFTCMKVPTGQRDLFIIGRGLHILPAPYSQASRGHFSPPPPRAQATVGRGEVRTRVPESWGVGGSTPPGLHFSRSRTRLELPTALHQPPQAGWEMERAAGNVNRGPPLKLPAREQTRPVGK
jgi:hypothetical protein